MNLDQEALLKTLYKSFDFELYQLCKNTFKKYHYLDLEELLLELYNDKNLINHFFTQELAAELFVLLKNNTNKPDYIVNKASKYLLNSFMKASKIASAQKNLTSTKSFLLGVLLTENKVSLYLKSKNINITELADKILKET